MVQSEKLFRAVLHWKVIIEAILRSDNSYNFIQKLEFFSQQPPTVCDAPKDLW